MSMAQPLTPDGTDSSLLMEPEPVGNDPIELKEVPQEFSVSQPGPPEENHPREHEQKREREAWPSVLADGWPVYWKKSLREVFLGSWMNLLLVTIPIAIFCKAGGASDGVVFVFSLLALCPLAERISFVTEDLAKYTNDTLGGLMNATMGNVTELIVSLFALKAGLIRVVQVSLIGSMFGNLLLVLGCAFFAGGLKHHSQRYNKNASQTNAGLLMLAVMGVLLPAVLSATHQEKTEKLSELMLSRVTAFSLLIVYGLLVFYQLKTHRYLFEGQEENEEDEPPVLGLWGSVGWMVVITIFIAVISEFVVGAIEGAAEDLGIPILFMGTILLPIVGNAAEHAASIIFALKNKMDISLGIAVGSATQISLFVLPLCVVVGIILGQPMDLNFHIFETATLFITVIMVTMLLSNGESDWLKGILLLMAYLLISASFWLHADPTTLEATP